MFNSVVHGLLLTLATLLLVLLNGVFVAAEFAIVRVRRTRLEELAGEGVEAAKSAIVVVDRISDYLALTQIGITVASLAVGWLAQDAVVQVLSLFSTAENQTSGLIHAGGVAVAFLVVTVLHVILGEQVPKLLAVRSAERYLLVLARPLRMIHFILRPFLRILERTTSWILHWMGHGVATHAPLTEDELKLILAESHKGGIVSEREAEIIVRAFEFADKQSEAIMIPAKQVSFISLDRTLEQNLDAARQHMHARLPVCRSGLDSVVGTVSMKDVWPLLNVSARTPLSSEPVGPRLLFPSISPKRTFSKPFRKAAAKWESYAILPTRGHWESSPLRTSSKHSWGTCGKRNLWECRAGKTIARRSQIEGTNYVTAPRDSGG